MASIEMFPTVPPLPQKEIPRWAIEDYEGDTQEMIQDIYAALFYREVSRMKIGDKTMPENMGVIDWYHEVAATLGENDVQIMQAQLVSRALSSSMETADGMKGKSDRAFMFFLYQLKMNNRYQMLGEYDSFEEYLVDKLPRLNENSGERSDIMFMLDEFIPLLKSLGSEWVEKLTELQDYYTKVRGAVPSMRIAMRELTAAAELHEEQIEKNKKQVSKLEDKKRREKNPEKIKEIEHEIAHVETHTKKLTTERKIAQEVAVESFKENTERIMKAVVDPNIKTAGINGIAHQLKRGKAEEFKGFVGMTDRHAVFVFAVPSKYMNAVQSALTFVNFNVVRDTIKIVDDLEKILKKDKVIK